MYLLDIFISLRLTVQNKEFRVDKIFHLINVCQDHGTKFVLKLVPFRSKTFQPAPVRYYLNAVIHNYYSIYPEGTCIFLIWVFCFHWESIRSNSYGLCQILLQSKWTITIWWMYVIDQLINVCTKCWFPHIRPLN